MAGFAAAPYALGCHAASAKQWKKSDAPMRRRVKVPIPRDVGAVSKAIRRSHVLID
jgi:hypothetical protein